MLRLALALTTALAVSLVAAPVAAAQTEPFKKVLDNSAPAFRASDNWKSSSWSPQKVGEDYRYAKPASVSDNAYFRMRVPRTTDYKVFVRWPATKGYNPETRLGVRTPAGVKWRKRDQTSKGGQWVGLGTFELQSGYRQRVIVSRRSGSEGYVIADAIRIVEADPPSKDSEDSGGTSRNTVLQEAKGWLGVPYRYGGASRSGVDCSGLTMRVFEKVNMSLPRTAASQYGRGRATNSPRVGDLAFGDYNDSGNIEHVGIYTGDGEMINAPYPGTVVRYDPIYPRYHVGYRDLLS